MKEVAMDREVDSFHPDVLAAQAQFGGDLESMQKCYDWYDLKKIVDRHTSGLARIPDTIHQVLVDHCGQEGGAPRIDWYRLRKELILAINLRFSD
jgi:hypothetical protein